MKNILKVNHQYLFWALDTVSPTGGTCTQFVPKLHSDTLIDFQSRKLMTCAAGPPGGTFPYTSPPGGTHRQSVETNKQKHLNVDKQKAVEWEGGVGGSK